MRPEITLWLQQFTSIPRLHRIPGIPADRDVIMDIQPREKQVPGAVDILITTHPPLDISIRLDVRA